MNPAPRVATVADLDALVRLAAQFRLYLRRDTPTDEWFRQAFARLLEDESVEFVVLCDGGGAPIGYVQSRYRFSAWNGGMEAELEDVFVADGERGRGAGRQLVDVALQRAAARCCRSVGITTNDRNQAALALYRRVGFSAERERWDGGRQLWLDRLL